MMKYIRFLIKAIPVLTIVGGFISGGGRLGPFLDTAKVAVTQYEVVQITKLVYDDAAESKGKIVNSTKFPSFVQDNFHSQYSILAREVIGNRSSDMSQDLWSKSFQIVFLEEIDQVKIASSGPDGKIGTKDDIAAEFPFQFKRSAKSIEKKRPVVVIAEETSTEVNQDHESDADHDSRDMVESDVELGDDRKPASEELAHSGALDEAAFDVDGFDRDGYDRDGYDSNGIHRSEKAASIQE